MGGCGRGVGTADEPQKARNLFRWAQACLEQSGNQQAEQLVDQSVAFFANKMIWLGKRPRKILRPAYF